MARFEITPERLASLPKWARQEIERLQRNEEHYVAQLAAGPEDSDTFADPYSEARRPLGRGTTIQFVLGQNKYGHDMKIQARLEQKSDGSMLLDINAGGLLQVFPRAANSIEIGVRPL